MNRLYLATRLFNVNDRLTSIDLCERVDSWIDDGLLPLEHSFLPYRDSNNEIPDDVEDWGQAVFDLDIQNLSNSVGIACYFDGPAYDSGIGFEIGFAYALGMPVAVVTTDYHVISIHDSEEYYSISKLIQYIATVIHVDQPSQEIEDYKEQCLDIRNQALEQLKTVLIENFNEGSRHFPPDMKDENTEYDYYLDPNFQYTESGRYILEALKNVIVNEGKTYIVGNNQEDIAEDLRNLANSGDVILFSEEYDPDVDTSLLQGISYGFGKMPILYQSKTKRYYNGLYVATNNLMCKYSAKAIVRSLAELEAIIRA